MLPNDYVKQKEKKILCAHSCVEPQCGWHTHTYAHATCKHTYIKCEQIFA